MNTWPLKQVIWVIDHTGSWQLFLVLSKCDHLDYTNVHMHKRTRSAFIIITNFLFWQVKHITWRGPDQLLSLCLQFPQKLSFVFDGMNSQIP